MTSRVDEIREAMESAAESAEFDWDALLKTARKYEEELRLRTSWTSDELLGTDLPETSFVVPRLLPEGLTVFGGRPKLGKSFAALQLAIAVASGESFLGAKAAQGSVLYLALEDSPRRIQDRLRAQRCPSSVGGRLHFEFRWNLLNDSGAELLAERVEALRPRLVVIDTISRVLPAKANQLKVEDMTVAFGGLQRMALHFNASVLLVEHLRKNDKTKDPVTDILGSTGKAAVADTIWGLYRERGQQAAQLVSTGRDIEGGELSLEFDGETCTWTVSSGSVHGAPAPDTDAQRRVLATLAEFGQPMTAKQLGALTKRDIRGIRKVANSMCDRGQLRQTSHANPHGGSDELVYHLLACGCIECAEA